MSEQKLKSCPFCGSGEIVLSVDAGFDDAMVACRNCQAMLLYHHTEEADAKAWNTRHEPQWQTREKFEASGDEGAGLGVYS